MIKSAWGEIHGCSLHCVCLLACLFAYLYALVAKASKRMLGNKMYHVGNIQSNHFYALRCIIHHHHFHKQNINHDLTPKHYLPYALRTKFTITSCIPTSKTRQTRHSINKKAATTTTSIE